MHCVACYTRIEDNEDFCSKCGVVVNRPKVAATSKPSSVFEVTLGGRMFNTFATSEGKAKNNVFFQYARDKGTSVKLVHHLVKTRQLMFKIKQVG